MYKLSFIESNIKEITDKPKHLLRQEAYKYIIKPDSQPKTFTDTDRALMAGLASLGTAGLSIGISSLINKKLKVPYLPFLIGGSLSAGTAGYFHPELRQKVLDYHKHKDQEKFKKAISPYVESEKNIYNKANEVADVIEQNEDVSKQAGFAGAVGRGIGNAISTAAKTYWGGLKFGPKPHLGQKIMGVVSKGSAMGAVGYGGYKAHQAFMRPESEGNYNTFLRNNIIAGNISGDEVSLDDKKQLNNLGMR